MLKSEVDQGLSGLPITLIIGSMRGVSRSDLKAYIEGLARSQCHSIDNVRYAIHKQHDKDSWIYEIHEGGCVKSVYTIIEKHFVDQEGPIRFALSDNRYSEIDVIDGDWVNVVGHAAEDMALLTPADTGSSLETFSSTNKGLKVFSLWLFVFSSILYIVLIIIMLISFIFASQGSYYQHMTVDDKSYQAAVKIEQKMDEYRLQLGLIQNERPEVYIKKIQYEEGSWSAVFSEVKDHE